jgi:hypothetical protein
VRNLLVKALRHNLAPPKLVLRAQAQAWSLLRRQYPAGPHAFLFHVTTTHKQNTNALAGWKHNIQINYSTFRHIELSKVTTGHKL